VGSGNYFVDLPYGIAVIVDDATGFLIDSAWDEKPKDVAELPPATSAPVFSYLRGWWPFLLGFPRRMQTFCGTGRGKTSAWARLVG
jgi:hypothetical protein